MLYCLCDRANFLQALPPGGVVAEIGVAKGDFSQAILDVASPAKLHLIDPWEEYSGYESDVNALNSSEQNARFFAIKERYRSQIASGQVQIHRSFSPDVADEFPDSYFDWIYIDGNHTYDAVKADLTAWSRKIKPNGFILGHDYADNHAARAGNFGVIPAVNEFVREKGWNFVAMTMDPWATYMLNRSPGTAPNLQAVAMLLFRGIPMIEIDGYLTERRGVTFREVEISGRRLAIPSF